VTSVLWSLGCRGALWLTVVVLTVTGATAGLIVAGAATATTAAADPIGDCTTSAGVIVAVDFTAWGGNIERGCDATPTTGYDALYAAGFTTADDAQDGPSFVCRIDNEPPPSQDACITTPPADAYWSYWHADAGADTWSYSQVGSMSYHPPAGSVDAWTFGATDIDGSDGQPSFPPSAVRATNTSVTSTSSTTVPAVTTTTTTPAPAPPPRTAGGGAAPASTRPSPSTTAGAGAGARGQPSVTTTPPSMATTTTAPRHREPRRRGGTPSARIVDAAPAATHRGSAGSPVAIVVGAGVVAALALCAAVVARRRRRPS
jgi:hypothetical protein